MEPQVIAAIISASASSATSLFTRFFPTPQKRASVEADEAIDKVYDKLRSELTSNCVRVLMALEHGENPTRSELRNQVFPDLKLGAAGLRNTFDGEFHYRLKTMCALGVILDIGGGREYAITKLGFAFLSAARERQNYNDILNS